MAAPLPARYKASCALAVSRAYDATLIPCVSRRLCIPNPVSQHSVGWQHLGEEATVATARRKTEAPNRREVLMSLGTNRTAHRR